MNISIVDMVESQTIASITGPDLIDDAIESNANVAFLVTGTLLTVREYMEKLRKAGMYVFLHMDFIGGLSNTKDAVQFVAREWKPDGIITTKNQLIKIAKDEGLVTIQRTFLIDHHAIQKSIKALHHNQPDAIEVLPGIMPKVINDMTSLTTLPIIAGGLIRDKQEVLDALQAGALATSGGSSDIWNLDL